MIKMYSMPHTNIRVIDQSIKEPYIPEEIPMHLPIFVSFAEKGIGLGYGVYDELKKQYGEGTFDTSSPYFTHQNFFLRTACQSQPVFFYRLIPDDAKTASLVLEAHTWLDEIIQYQRDENGFYLLDENGNKIPETIPDSTDPLTKPGIKIKWKIRALADNETITGLQSSQYTQDSKTVTVYPILAFIPKYGPGKYANNHGIALWWDHESDIDLIHDNEALIYNISFYDQPHGYDTPIHVRDFYNAVFEEFMFYPDAKDSRIDMKKDFSSVMNIMFGDDLYVNFNVYTNYIEELGNLVKTYEEEEGAITEITTPWMANIIAAKSTENVPYYRTEIVIDGDAILLEKDVVHNFLNGEDGTLSNDNLETLAQKFFRGELFPEFQDDMKYPFNHIYDSGFTIDTKKAMFEMLSLRDDVHVIVGSHVNGMVQTEAESQSIGASLRINALLYPESIIDGTQTCRVTIFGQAFINNFDNNYQDYLPLTFFALISRCKYHNATYIKGEWKGLPRSSCDFIKAINWAPYLKDVKQLHWDTGINYCEYYDMKRLHFPDIISVYPYQTSVLSSDTFTTYIVYLKQIAKAIFRKYVGMEEPVSKLKDKMEKDLNDIIYRKFKEYIKVIPSVYQTDLDEQLGYSLTIELAVYDSVAKRVFNVIIYTRRIEDLQK